MAKTEEDNSPNNRQQFTTSENIPAWIDLFESLNGWWLTVDGWRLTLDSWWYLISCSANRLNSLLWKSVSSDPSFGSKNTNCSHVPLRSPPCQQIEQVYLIAWDARSWWQFDGVWLRIECTTITWLLSLFYGILSPVFFAFLLFSSFVRFFSCVFKTLSIVLLWPFLIRLLIVQALQIVLTIIETAHNLQTKTINN